MQERINTNPHIVHFVLKKNKNFPNNQMPVIIYREAIQLPKQRHRASDIAQKIILKNGWSNTWRNGIYDFHHYHSNTHECLVISMGKAEVMLGGPNGKKVKLSQGDVILLPAGVAHKCVAFSKDFMCVGSYPQGKNYDMNYGTSEELTKALPRIKKLSIPMKDPLYGKEGFMKLFWK